MTKITAIFSYNEGSEGAKALGQLLGVKRIKHEGSKFKGRADKVVLNWGASVVPPEVAKCRVLNNPRLIGPMSNKLKFFELMGDDVRTPEWTVDRAIAIDWQLAGAVVVERHKLQGHSAEGLRIVEKGVDIQRAPLYTKYVPKKDEFRVHFFGKNIIDIQQKKKRNDFDGDVNWKVRNHANGFIYARQDLNVPKDVTDQALACAAASGLDFGAVDIIYNAHADQAYVLEVNTAPGLSGETVAIYAAAIKEFV
jgi:hypothetical protein